MCGIIGYVGTEDAIPIIIDGLKKLEYRGYDSAGLAVFNGGKIDVVKQKGRLIKLEQKMLENSMCGTVGIGHTRWATHGEPSDINSHPHIGSLNKIAIVHNGIIENYKSLRDMLEQRNIVFHSDTDSEIVAQLAEYYYNGDIMDTVLKVIAMLEGSYALGIMCVDNPDKIIAVRKDNPLIIGLSNSGNFIASDVSAILKHTDTVCYLEDREIAVLEKGGVTFYSLGLDVIEKLPEKITWTYESAEKGGYEHFMFKEIMEQPRVVRDTVNSLLSGHNKTVFEKIDITAFNKIIITACGSAYNAGVVGKYTLEKLLKIPVECDLASEFRYRDAIADENTLVILVSQSGETADTIAAMREAKRKKCQTLAIVNVVGSTIAKEADIVTYTMAGPEIAVATTKAFSAQLVTLYLLGVGFAAKTNRISDSQKQEYIAEISSLPTHIENLFINIGRVQQYATTCFNCKSIFFIGRNIDYAIALEGSLKLKEISYIHSEAYAGGELKHGTISLIEDNTLVVAISGVKRLYKKIVSNVEQVISRGAKVLFITNSEEAQNPSDKVSYFKIADINELFSPTLSVILMQLLSYYVAANKGCDIDKPRNLAKSVTVE